MNALDYTTLLTLSPAVPNGAQRSVNVCTQWSDDGLNVMLETISPDRTGEFAELLISHDAVKEEDYNPCEGLAAAVVGACLWVHFPSIDWCAGQDMGGDLMEGDISKVIAEYRAPFVAGTATDLILMSLDIVKLIAQLLAGGDELALMPGELFPG